VSNLDLIVAPDAGSASSRCFWTVLTADGDHPIAVSLSGQHVDRFAKVDGRRRFADRLVTIDLGLSPPIRPPDLG
jgi:hypothetical protein